MMPPRVLASGPKPCGGNEPHVNEGNRFVGVQTIEKITLKASFVLSLTLSSIV